MGSRMGVSGEQVAARGTRRATVPPHATRLRVSLHRLPLATVHNQLTTVHNDINNKLSKVVVHQTELRTDESKLDEQEQAGVKHEHSESKLEDMKLEMAKLDSILQGNLLLDKSSHKISDMLLLDTLKSRVKQEYPKLAGNYGRDRSSISCKDGTDEGGEEGVTCKWEGCGERLEPQQLLDHLTVTFLNHPTQHKITVSHQDQHVSQPGSSVGCRWAGCKVFGAVSSSRTWLSHHVTSHIGSKPFLCIVAGCRQRFGTQVSLIPIDRSSKIMITSFRFPSPAMSTPTSSRPALQAKLAFVEVGRALQRQRQCSGRQEGSSAFAATPPPTTPRTSSMSASWPASRTGLHD